MALTVQDDTGLVEGADSYLSVEDFAAYHAARGNSLGSYSSTQQEQALVRATDYLDGRFRFVGVQLNGPEQATEWPRSNARNRDRRMVYGIPRQVKEAVAEYALRALSGAINPDPGGTTSSRVRSVSQEVKGLKKSVTYAEGKTTLPEYPAADNKMRRAGLIAPENSGNISRG